MEKLMKQSNFKRVNYRYESIYLKMHYKETQNDIFQNSRKRREIQIKSRGENKL